MTSEIISDKILLKNILPTVFIKKEATALKQLVRIELVLSEPCNLQLLINNGNICQEVSLGTIPAGDSTKEIFIDELQRETELEFILKSEGIVYDKRTMPWIPPRHWTVHVVQLSHHDPGYTDIPSNVLKDHDRWLSQAIDMAKETEELAEDAKFRIVVEQAWSIDHFLKHASAERAEKAVKLIQEGRFEVTALFGNMTSELCGHEVLVRTLYHSGKLKRKYGFDIVSAEHNDIPGISWGLSRVLTDAGIKIFCPGLPLYYSWGQGGISSFWDQSAIFSHKGPGAFWWEAPSGKRILFWCNNSGCGGDTRGNLPGLAAKLLQLENAVDASGKRNYPYSIIRWPVGGGARDNSPYIIDYAYTIQQWNEKWAFPHLICSTNAKFYNDFINQIPAELPVLRGELAGQDYPVASTSTASATAANRNNHCSLPAAEKLSVYSALAAGHIYPEEELYEAYEDVLWHDEHAWGFHFPCGPAMKASEYEKAVHAYRASALAHGAIQKAMACIADKVKIDKGDFHLVVFNMTQYLSTSPVHAQLREIDNSGSVMYKVPPQEDPIGSGYLRGMLLNDRWHANPPPDIVEGRFELIDVDTGETIPFQITEVASAMDTVPFAAERLGLGSGTRRYGFFEEPFGIKRELCFIACNVPGNGYKTYRLKAINNPKEACSAGMEVESNHIEAHTDGKEAENNHAEAHTDGKEAQSLHILNCEGVNSASICALPDIEGECCTFQTHNQCVDNVISDSENECRILQTHNQCDESVISTIENEYYRVSVSHNTGAVISIYDKHTAGELVDKACPHGFNAVLVRNINQNQEIQMKCLKVETKKIGSVFDEIEVNATIYGHPVIRQTIRLYKGIGKVYFATRILKDSTPLLNTCIAFPFKAVDPKFRYESSLSVMNPIQDYLPGSHSDTIAVQNWVKVSSTGISSKTGSETGSNTSGETGITILWSSLDAPIACMGRFWPGYTSPAHRCFFDPATAHNPLKEVDMDKGWIYSNIFTNNYGTNFYVSQNGDVLFRYVLTSCEGDVSDAKAAAFGGQAVVPFEQIYTKHERQRTLPVKSKFIEIKNDNVVLLTCKKAEYGEGYILRLWNLDNNCQTATVIFNFFQVASARVVNIVEEDNENIVVKDNSSNSFQILIEKNSVVTVRIVPEVLNPELKTVKNALLTPD